MFAVQVFVPSEHRATMLQPVPAGVFFRKLHDAAPARARSSPRTIGTAVRRSAGLGQASGHQVPTNFSRAAGGSGFGSAADAVSTSGCAGSERAVSDCPSTGLSGLGAGDAGSAATAAGAVSAGALVAAGGGAAAVTVVGGPAGFGSAGAVAMGAEGVGGSGAGAVEPPSPARWALARPAR